MNFQKTVPHLDLSRFMKPWYVIAGRTTFFEKGAHNSVERYTWNDAKERIDVDFTFNRNSFEGKKRSFPQIAWVSDPVTNAHWIVQPIWPLKFDYLVIALHENYEWTAVGVPSGKYLWIMSENPKMSEKELAKIIKLVEASGYPVHDIVRVPQEARGKKSAKGSRVPAKAKSAFVSSSANASLPPH